MVGYGSGMIVFIMVEIALRLIPYIVPLIKVVWSHYSRSLITFLVLNRVTIWILRGVRSKINMIIQKLFLIIIF
jgi:hypothetical protein